MVSKNLFIQSSALPRCQEKFVAGPHNHLLPQQLLQTVPSFSFNWLYPVMVASHPTSKFPPKYFCFSSNFQGNRSRLKELVRYKSLALESSARRESFPRCCNSPSEKPSSDKQFYSVQRKATWQFNLKLLSNHLSSSLTASVPHHLHWQIMSLFC